MTPDEGRSPSYRDTFRRHRRLLSVPMIIGVLLGGVFAFNGSKTYMSTARLWVDTAPPAQSTVGDDGPVLSTTPASAEQSVLIELLTTQAFAKAVAHNSLLGKYLASGAGGGGPLSSLTGGSMNTLKEALSPAQVMTLPTGPQILQISYAGPTPAVAKSTLGALVKQLQDDSSGFTSEHDQATLAYDRAQVKVAAQAVGDARKQVSQYLKQNPGATNNQDPNLAVLSTAESAAANQLTQATTALNQASVKHNGGWAVKVIDAPGAASPVGGGKKKMLELILGGLLAGALISFLGSVALTPGRKEVWEDELPTSTPGSRTGGGWSDQLPPPIPPPATAKLSDPSGDGDLSAALLGGRRFIVPNFPPQDKS
jgi:uncharacterized protein involved in exopolysaccharide biosynthesis